MQTPIANLGQSFPHWLQDSTLGQEAFSVPPQQPVGKDFAHTRRFSLSGPVARSFFGTLQAKALLAGFLVSRMHIYVLCTHMYLGRERLPLGFSLRVHLKHWLWAKPKWPVDGGICRQPVCCFHLAWNAIEHLWVWGKEGWVGSWGMSSFPFLSWSPSIAWALSAPGRLPSPVGGQPALISLRLGSNSTLLYAKYPPGCPTFLDLVLSQSSR